jgi:ClpP class serine protease
MSGGTLIALAADAIVMSPHAVLGPVDPQVGQYPAASLLKVIAKKPVAEIDDQTLILADVGEKAIAQLRESVAEILTRSLTPEKSMRLAELLATGTWTHDYPIIFPKATELGLSVRSDMPSEILQLMSLYPQPTTRSDSRIPPESASPRTFARARSGQISLRRWRPSTGRYEVPARSLRLIRLAA